MMVQRQSQVEQFESAHSQPVHLSQMDPQILDMFRRQMSTAYLQPTTMVDMPPHELMAYFTQTYGVEGAIKLLHNLGHHYPGPPHPKMEPIYPPTAPVDTPRDLNADYALKERAGDCKKKRRASPKHLMCHVCGDKAPNHCHYGGIACFSCRAFFRRSVPKHRSYTCSSNNQCAVTPATRKNCQKCRFDKCLGAGMKASWVLSDEEKLERLEKKRSRKQPASAFPPTSLPSSHESSCSSSPVFSSQYVNQNYDQMSESSGISSRPASQESFDVSANVDSSKLLTFDEEGAIDAWVRVMEGSRHTIPMSGPVLEQMVKLTHTGEGIHPDTILDFFKTVYCRIVNSVNQLGSFSQLSDGDKKRLLSKNMDMISTIQIASTLFADGRANLDAQIQFTGHAEEIANLTGHMGMEVKQLFVRPWAKNESHMEYFYSTTRQLAKLLREDPRVSTLFQLVALFHGENLELKDERIIEAVQEAMATLLHKYLKSRFGPQLANSTFSNLMSSLYDLRYLAEILTQDS